MKRRQPIRSTFVERSVEEGVTYVIAHVVGASIASVVIVVVRCCIGGGSAGIIASGVAVLVASCRPVLVVRGGSVRGERRERWQKSAERVGSAPVMMEHSWRGARGCVVRYCRCCSRALIGCSRVMVRMLLLEFSWWFALTPFGSSVLKPNLNSRFTEL